VLERLASRFWRQPPAEPGSAGHEPVAARSVRVTWVQPEDLLGHELRQAREEGKDVDELEERWFAAGGAPAPARGASQEPVEPALRALALELLDELAAIPRPLGAVEPDVLDAILALADPVPARAPTDARARIAGAWLGRAAGCVLGKPVEGIPRQWIRELAEATGNWPVTGWFTAQGLPDEISARWPWNRASRPTSLAESIDGIPEDDDLNFTMLGVALLERCGVGFDSPDVAKVWLDYQPPGRIFTAERVAVRNLLEAYLPPETGMRRNPFREWIGARLRVDAYGWAAGGDPVAAARMAWADARVSHAANGIFAAMFMAAAHAMSMSTSSSAACADAGLSVVPSTSRLAEALRAARDLAGEHDWEAVVDELYERYGRYHWVHAINNTAAVAAALYAYDGDFSGAIGAVVQAGWDTDTNGAAVGSILGATVGPDGIDARWTAPLQGRFASSLPGFDGITLDELVERTLAVAPVDNASEALSTPPRRP
jgi:ADP-ribosylglycohydrolase